MNPTDTRVETAIAENDHTSFETADAVPSASEAKENVLYLVMNAKTNHYDIYAKIGTEVVLLTEYDCRCDLLQAFMNEEKYNDDSEAESE